MMNMLRFFTRPLAAQAAQDRITQLSRGIQPQFSRIGRMPAEMTMSEIKSELLKLVGDLGWESVGDQINAESLLLRELEQRLNAADVKIQQIVDGATKRAQDGYSVGGMYWERINNECNQVIPSKTEYKSLAEQRDWLRARQAVFTELAPTHSTWSSLGF